MQEQKLKNELSPEDESMGLECQNKKVGQKLKNLLLCFLPLLCILSYFIGKKVESIFLTKILSAAIEWLGSDIEECK